MGKKIKISAGLARLISGEANLHFQRNRDVFTVDPKSRTNYLDSFNHALVLEVAHGEFPIIRH